MPTFDVLAARGVLLLARGYVWLQNCPPQLGFLADVTVSAGPLFLDASCGWYLAALRLIIFFS